MGNPVTVEVNLNEANFVLYDEEAYTLVIPEEVTKREDIGQYEININLFDIVDEVQTQYNIIISIFENDNESDECGEE